MNADRKTCADRVRAECESVLEDLKILVELDELENERADYSAILEKLRDEHGRLEDYGCSLDLVEAGTFEDQREDYFCYQISTGGPGSEFRIYKNGEIEFWFLDWGDGASEKLTGEDWDLVAQIVEPFLPDGWNIYGGRR